MSTQKVLFGLSRCIGRLLAIAAVVLALLPAGLGAQETVRDASAALDISQAAIGQNIGDYTFTANDGRKIRLADLRGRPVALSFIYTSCADTCPTITDTLAEAAESTWDALGDDAFTVVTIGFDAAADTPTAMRLFAGRRAGKYRQWLWLSGSLPDIAALARDTGFVFFESAKGFDHTAQITLIDGDGVVRAQIYGEDFALQKFADPIRSMLIRAPIDSDVSWSDRVRLFCTVYDPRTGKYTTDYSFYIELFAGATVLLPVAWFLFRNIRRQRRNT